MQVRNGREYATCWGTATPDVPILRESPENKWYVGAIDGRLGIRFNRNMLRCQSCDGILTKTEAVCYQCGDPVPGHEKSKWTFFPMLLIAALLLTLGFAAYSSM
jgi:uncharacterized paraquat-inducible protein A